jgi:hypothetical protein
MEPHLAQRLHQVADGHSDYDRHRADGRDARRPDIALLVRHLQLYGLQDVLRARNDKPLECERHRPEQRQRLPHGDRQHQRIGPNPCSDRHARADANTNADPDTYANADTDAYPNTNAGSDTYANAHTTARADANTNTDSASGAHAHANADTSSGADANTNANAGPRDRSLPFASVQRHYRWPDG